MSTTDLAAFAISRAWPTIPLLGKIPLVKWAEYRITSPSADTMIQWFAEHPYANVGIITGAGSNLLVLDYDGPPYPENDWKFTTTPRGRHYYFFWDQANLGHGLRLMSNLDIPILVRLYEKPTINHLDHSLKIPGLPNQAHPSPFARLPTSSYKPRFTPEKLPPFELLRNNCEFVKWFLEQRNDPNWQSRYQFARAYTNSACRTETPDLGLGPNYRHTADILNRPGPPIRCSTIYKFGFHCPNIQPWDGQCSLTPNVHTPLDLARRLHAI